jgi:hypothetical protein
MGRRARLHLLLLRLWLGYALQEAKLDASGWAYGYAFIGGDFPVRFFSDDINICGFLLSFIENEVR